jgi:sugar phosphate isomerase/epimerase
MQKQENSHMLNVRIGNQSAFSAMPITAPFDFACDSQYDAFEWFIDKRPNGNGWTEVDFSPMDREKIRIKAKECNIAQSLHFSIQNNVPNILKGENIAREAAFARDIGADICVLHFDFMAGIESFVDAVQFLLKGSSLTDMQLALENTVWTDPGQINAFFAMLSMHEPELGKKVGLCFDMGHANLASATHNNYIGFLERLDPHIPIIHAHLHENWGEADTHLPLFTGPSAKNIMGLSNLFYRFNQRKFEGRLILEQWPNPASILTQTRQKLLNLLQNSAK